MSRVACLVLVMICMGCQRSTQTAGKPVVGVVPKGANHSFWPTVHAGAIKAGREYGFEVEWNAPASEVDASRQIEIVDSMIGRKLAGIVLAPIDRKALVSTVERATEQGIPVSIFDSAVATNQIVSYVATDNLEAGRMAARRMGEVLGGKGKVAVVGFMPGSAATMEREDGFQSEIRKRYPNVNIVGLQFGMADRAKAMAVTENILTAHPDLAGLFADNESSSMGALQALKSRQAKNVKLVAFDASEQLLSDLREGVIDSLIVQNPFRMGYESAKAIGLHLRGEKPPDRVDSGARLILREDLDKAEVKELVNPDVGAYLVR